MKKNLIVFFVLAFMLLAPLAVVDAQGVGQSGTTSAGCVLGSRSGNLFGILCRVGQLINAVIPVLIALGVLFFVWGVITYVIASDEEAKSAGKDRIIYGIIGLAVIIGLWGLVAVVRNTFNLDNTTNTQLPTVPICIGPECGGGTNVR